MDERPARSGDNGGTVPSITARAVEELGERVQAALLDVVAGPAGNLPRPTHLARTWNLDQTFCTRVCSALRMSDPLAVLSSLPAVGSLTGLLEKAEARGAAGAPLSRARAAIDELRQLIERLGGKKSNLDTLIGSHDPGAREKLERTAKQSIYRGMGSLLGTQCETSLTTYFVRPSEGDLAGSRCDEYAVYGVQRLQRLRPERTILVGGRRLHRESGAQADHLERARQHLHTGDLRDDRYTTALPEFSSDPFPQIEVELDGERLLYTAPGDPTGAFREFSAFFASLDRGAAAREATEGETHAEYIFLPRNPARDLLLDIFVHESLWPGVAPELWIGRGETLLDLDSRQAELAGYDFHERIAALPADRNSLRVPFVRSYRQLVEHVLRELGGHLEEHRLFRLHVRYPVVGFAYAARFPLPRL